MDDRPKQREPRWRQDRWVLVSLAIIGVLVRLPFLSAFDLVSYDGTYYINQAKFLLGQREGTGGAFPLGYPALIALFLPVIGDGVRAAQAVSFLASMGALFAFYLLVKKLVGQGYAFFGSVILSLTPLFVHVSLSTMSESLYLLWLILGLLFYAKQRGWLCGLAMGLAAATRPEALGVFVILAALRWKHRRQLGGMVASFLILFVINSAVLTKTGGHLVLLPKSGLFAAGVGPWQRHESWIEFEGKQAIDEELVQERESASTRAYYLERLPREVYLLARHATPVILLLALYGIYVRRTFLIAALLPFFVYPLFTPKTEARFVIPYVPILILYAMIGLEAVPRKVSRPVVYALVAISAVFGMLVNSAQVRDHVSAGYEWAKRDGMQMRKSVESSDKVADRKPFFAFYAGGRYVEIPVASYEELVDHLYAEDVRFLVLHRETVHYMRPALKPLIYNRAYIAAETRFAQVYADPEGVLIYERSDSSSTVETRPLAIADPGLFLLPAWSPDGQSIACWRAVAQGSGQLCVVSVADGTVECVVEIDGKPDPVDWSPDGRRLVYANTVDGNVDVYAIDVSTHESSRITLDPAEDYSPSWGRGGKELAFCSDRSGRKQVWSKNLDTGELTQLTIVGENMYPALSPDGNRIAFVRLGEGLLIYDRVTKQTVQAELPKQPSNAPVWSRDGRFIAITGEGYGGASIYLMTADGRNAVALTKVGRSEGMPSWSPDGRKIIVVSRKDAAVSLSITTGFETCLRRVMTPPSVKTLQALPDPVPSSR